VAAWAVPYGYNGGVPITAANPDRVFHSLPEMSEYVIEMKALSRAEDQNIRGH
jgi:phosphoglycolate phosphatase